MAGLMATSPKRAYVIPRSTAPSASVPAAAHCWPIPPQETPKHSPVSVSVGPLGPGAHKVCLSPLSISGGYGVWFWMQFLPSYYLSGASSLPLDMGYLLKECLKYDYTLPVMKTSRKTWNMNSYEIPHSSPTLIMFLREFSCDKYIRAYSLVSSMLGTMRNAKAVYN